MDQMTTDVVTEYIEGTKGDDEVEVAKTTSATMTTKTMTTTMATMIMTKTLIPPLNSLCMLLCLPGTGRGWFNNCEKEWKAGQPPNTDPNSGEAFRSWQQGPQPTGPWQQGGSSGSWQQGGSSSSSSWQR